MISARAALVVALGVILVFLPWIAYGAGLWNVADRPVSSIKQMLTPDELEFLHLATRKSGDFRVAELDPWTYTIASVREPERLTTPGLAAARIVARHHNASHLRIHEDRRLVKLSETAMVIWLTRNWTSDQIMVKAFEIEHARLGGRLG